MNALIVDDNKMARIALSELAGRIDDLTIVAECSNAFEAYNLILSESIDLLLLDIEMPGMSGLELTKNLKNKRPVIIFITSRKEYAADAFDLNVADYIIKPVTGPRFIQAIDKVREILDSNQEDVKLREEEFVFIRDSNIVRRLKLDSILFAEAMGDYVKLYTAEKFYAIHTTLKAVEERLPASRFLRVHRSYLVNINKIDSMEAGALIIDRKPVPVADAYRAALNKRMNII
jgi:DNA-binding LytR/AlgR family response regulator